MVCNSCCQAAKFDIGSASYPLGLVTLLSAVGLVAVSVALLFKLVSGFRVVATTALRGKEAVVVSPFYFRFLLTAVVVLLAEAFILFLPITSWSFYVSGVAFSFRTAIVTAPVWFSLGGAKYQLVRIIGGVSAMLILWLCVVFIFVNAPSQRTSLLGTCVVCEHFLPLSYELFGVSVVLILFYLVLLIVAGRGNVRLGPRVSMRPYLAFLLTDGVVSAVGIALALWGATPELADAGICFVILDVPVFLLGFFLACYYSFSWDSKLLWQQERSTQQAEYWRHDSLLGITENASIHIFDESELVSLGRVLGRGGE